MAAYTAEYSVCVHIRVRVRVRVRVRIDVNRFYPKTQLSWLARLDHSHCNSADPLTDGLEVCCVFYRPGPGGAMCVVWWWKAWLFLFVTSEGTRILIT